MQSFNPDMDPLPPKYPEPAKAYLTIFLPGGGSKVIPVDEISGEEIMGADKTVWYTGVSPDLTHHRLARRWLLPFRIWKTVRMHYSMFGWPFTFDPKTFVVFSNEKKRRILIARGAGIPIEVGDRSVVVLIDPETQGTKEPRPIWQVEEITEADKAKIFKGEDPKTFFELEAWVKANIELLEQMEHIQLPVATVYDVDDMEMLRSETFHFVENEVIEKGFKSMEQLGEEKSLLWIFIVTIGALVLMVFLFLYFANDGVFDKRDPVPGVGTLLSLLGLW